MKRAIFLDKDGTLVEDIPFNLNPEQIQLRQKSMIGLQNFQEFGYLLIVVTNQSGVAHGIMDEDDLTLVKNKLSAMLNTEGVGLDDFYYCPHDINGSIKKYTLKCRCHKPAPGMILRAAHKHNIDLFHSWVIGDTLNDIEAGNRAGCNTVLIDNNGKTKRKLGKYQRPTYVVGNIDEAADRIIQYSYLNSIYE